MVEDMRPSTRQMMIMFARSALQLERELLQEMAQILIDDIDHLSNDERKRIDECIYRMKTMMHHEPQ